MSQASPAIVWFRQDLRLGDHPALRAAVDSGRPVLCIFVLDDQSAALRRLGGAARWWLHHSLAALDVSLRARGGRLDLFRGKAADILGALVENTGAEALFWTRRYDSAEIALDTEIKAALGARVHVESFNGKLLAEPWTVKTKTGGPFRVFTPFWRALRAQLALAPTLSAPQSLTPAAPPAKALALDDLGLLPQKPDWAAGFRALWTPGEAAAQARLADFIDDALIDYADQRDRPDRATTSRLAAPLAFGELSPRQIWFAVEHAVAARPALARGAEKFLSEIGWREFSYHLLFHNPNIARENFDRRFDGFSWGAPDESLLTAWRRGLTGYPLVDAGMRELWTTGTMHNRVRMIVASFLVKHLLIDWRIGEEWFWDTLCDADGANNPASWQWVAGCGADAAPYFRIFNPVAQGERFDPEGVYVRRWIPELADVPTAYVHKPWTAPRPPALYPAPIVDHAKARARALAAFDAIKN